MNASCMLYSFKIVSPMRQGLLTSALSATNTTFNAREANIAVQRSVTTASTLGVRVTILFASCQLTTGGMGIYI